MAAQRVKMVFGVHMPTLPALRKYAAIFVRLRLDVDIGEF
jgi:hypothetical protein